jgi:hypothetical protein
MTAMHLTKHKCITGLKGEIGEKESVKDCVTGRTLDEGLNNSFGMAVKEDPHLSTKNYKSLEHWLHDGAKPFDQAFGVEMPPYCHLQNH